MSINDLKARVNDLHRQYIEARNALHDAQLAAAPVHAGDVVQTKKGELRVTKVENLGYGKPWVSGNLRKKDGAWSTAERNLFSDWEWINL